ncbi:hypothetical protein [Parasitella parasitica]|uniref:Eukaryotic translation initiation factor 4E n=1 Tax=Parasitella parasitica TaxID=35722 RepID=A0A0B7MXX3_9FUNG|nr:hypothetical protein [Parasitella parasitica]
MSATVAQSPEVREIRKTIDYNVKHPLQNTWTLWFDSPKKGNAQSWADNLKEIIDIDTAEDFWSTLNNVAKVNHAPLNSNYHLFKQNVRPEWEDEANANGGKFSIQFPKNKTGDVINEYWTYLLLAVIGEQLATEEEICGAVVSVRKSYYRIALWVKTCDDEQKIEEISKQLRATLKLSEDISIDFTPHDKPVSKVAATDATDEASTNEAAPSAEADPAKTAA